MFWLLLLILATFFALSIGYWPTAAATLATVAVVLFTAVVIAAAASAVVYALSSYDFRRRIRA